MIPLALSNLGLLALLVFVLHQWAEERQTLLDRIQAPERVVERRVEPGGDDPLPVPHDDDEAFFTAMKERA